MIYEKLNAIQTRLKCNKGQYNSFGNYKYRSCEDILEAVKPHLAETKTVLTVSDEIVQIGNHYYVKATATLRDIEDSSEINATAYAREEESKKGMDSSQVTGATSSYARKYALNGLFCIDDTKDADATNRYGKDEETPNKAGNVPFESCAGCGCAIEDTTGRAGNLWPAADIVKYSKRRFGRTLCPACQKAAMKAEVETT